VRLSLRLGLTRSLSLSRVRVGETRPGVQLATEPGLVTVTATRAVTVTVRGSESLAACPALAAAVACARPASEPQADPGRSLGP
jgi:hypothetical protein